MTPDPRTTSARLLREYAREPGRSVAARVETPDATWEGGVEADAPRRAASLLKLPLAIAAERAFAAGTLDPEEPVAVERLRFEGRGPQPLRVLRPGLVLSAADVTGLSLALSDRGCATWLLEAVGIDAVREVLAGLGCAGTEARSDEGPGGPIAGVTTAADALRLIAAATDEVLYPLTSAALEHTVQSSRIPLGATGLDVRLAHKTGSLRGVANDAAVIRSDAGRLLAAFLTEAQHDTLVTGYEMGVCTRGLLEAWDLAVRDTRGLA